MIRRRQLDELMTASASVAHALYGTVLERWRNTESKLRHSARMAQLGTLSAGLSHELNNPAAAMESAAARLTKALERRDEAQATMAGLTLGEAAQDTMRSILANEVEKLGGLDRMDREEAVEDLLGNLGVAGASRLAPSVVALGCSDEQLTELAAGLDAEGLAAVLGFLAADRELRDLFAQLRSGAGRISDLVGAMKRHSFLDQAPVQAVDVVQQLRDTLVILSTKLAGIDIEWEIDGEIPRIEAAGSELGQVWTILLDNAAYAIREAGRDPGTITLRVRYEPNVVHVEIEDDGTGIPDEIRDRVFDPFFTTKPPGSGPGLGLHTAHSTIADTHKGTISFDTGEGWTRFVVELPD
jgi:signal transduction histidine kinase